jgi:hypothetical protein
MPEFDFDRPGAEVRVSAGAPEMVAHVRAACDRCRSACPLAVDALFDVAARPTPAEG